MSTAGEAVFPPLADRERIIVALDVASADEARALVDELKGSVGAFKVGLQLFTTAGPEFVRELTAQGHRIFLDLKFHDIPNTVARAAAEAVKLGVWMYNVHASGGSEMMRRTVEAADAAARSGGVQRPLLLGVTVLTSSDAETLNQTGVADQVDDLVTRLASLSEESGLDGVVASPREAENIRKCVTKPGFLIVTPGIRASLGTMDDQKRVTTLRQAVRSGADYVVIGRPITEAANRLAAVDEIIGDVENGA